MSLPVLVGDFQWLSRIETTIGNENALFWQTCCFEANEQRLCKLVQLFLTLHCFEALAVAAAMQKKCRLALCR